MVRTTKYLYGKKQNEPFAAFLMLISHFENKKLMLQSENFTEYIV